MNEFELIRRYFGALAPQGAARPPGLVLGMGDDAALLELGAGEQLAVSIDTLVAGRHFPQDTAPADIGWKALAVNLSDLAAMGAEPRAFLLALTLPEADPAWLAAFTQGLDALARQHRVALVGGDTTRGPLSITVTVLGAVPAGCALRRDGGRPGDLVCVTGTLGDAALGLRRLGAARSDPDEVFLRTRLDRPVPRVAAGMALRGLAHAALDLSDGLVGDLEHILAASHLGAVLHTERLPRSMAFARLAAPDEAVKLQLAGGDDYELCVCLPPTALAVARAALDVPLSVVGALRAAPGLELPGVDIASLRAYRHFE